MKFQYSYLLIWLLYLPSLMFAQDMNLTRQETQRKVTQSILQPSHDSIITPELLRRSGISCVTDKNFKQVLHNISNALHGHIDHKAFPYNTTKDHYYNFGQSTARTINIVMKDGRLRFPDFLRKDWDKYTVILEAHVKSDRISAVYPPKITFISHKKSYTYELAPLSQGRRYFNISPLQPDLKGVKIEGEHTRMLVDKIKVHFFKNPPLKDKKILVIAPHPDDAEIAAYGLYSTHAKESYIVTITAGDAGSNKFYKKLTLTQKEEYLEKGKRRVIEGLSVPLLGNIPVDHLFNLGYFDSKLEEMYADTDRNVSSHYLGKIPLSTFRKYNISANKSILKGKGANWSSLVSDLSALIGWIQPDIIVTPYPALDRHHDHKFATVAVIEALRKIKYHKGWLFLYTNHATPTNYYPFGKKGTPYTLPPEYAQKDYFDQIYSFPLDRLIQAEKTEALDSMSDVRYWIPTIKDDTGMCERDYSYQRRAVRTNELFFLIKVENIYKRDVLESLYGNIAPLIRK